MREAGAVPATIAVVDGELRIGLDRRGARGDRRADGVAKCGVRDLAVVMRARRHRRDDRRRHGHLAARAGIGVFATGGLGGVHREARESWDESADLDHARARRRSPSSARA